MGNKYGKVKKVKLCKQIREGQKKHLRQKFQVPKWAFVQLYYPFVDVFQSKQLLYYQKMANLFQINSYFVFKQIVDIHQKDELTLISLLVSVVNFGLKNNRIWKCKSPQKEDRQNIILTHAKLRQVVFSFFLFLFLAPFVILTLFFQYLVIYQILVAS
eukprot:TRINITY_DN2649_c0_g1_i10.p8 TRINITY_DN2649_c0_g1~~TRINITY_DN2649_c0_g1_i10.p8  ORF type:complete len:158 (-),score=5.96 TRINITY_DN2649_c0_g1_i10:841-1314(-)